MLRLFIFLAVIVALATGLSWLADRPGNLVIDWQGYVIETSVFRAVVILAMLVGFALFAWSLLRHIWESPATIGGYFNRRRQKHGLDALSSGMIAIGSGDRDAATRYAVQARKSLPNEPMTHLLRAQAAQLAGDKTTARRIFEAMLSTPETEQLGLRGLFLEAEREGEREAAKQFAERAVELNPKLGWSVDALFDLQCRDADWAGALETLSAARKHGHIDKKSADRRRAILLTAKAQIAEDQNPDRAKELALEAHKLAPNLVPAAAIAGRLLASRGNTAKATKVIQKTWQNSPHPELAVAYAYARLGDSPKDRLDRVKKLAGLNPYSLESSIAVATAAIEAKDYDTARGALEPLIDNRLTQRVCTLMARIEGAQHGDKGRVREWLARAVNAPRDPAWTADGIVSETWQPVSPVTGALDAFQWRVPVESAEKSEGDLLARKLEELVALGASPQTFDADSAIEGGGEGSSAQAATSAPVASAKVERDAAVDADIVEPAKDDSATAKTSGNGKGPDATADTAKPTVEEKSAAAVVEKSQDEDTEVTQPSAKSEEAKPVIADGAKAKTDGKGADKAAAADVEKDKPAPDVSKEEKPDKPAAAPAEKASPSAPTGEKPPAASKSSKDKADPEIFVSPRAPDDPGTDADQFGEIPTKQRVPYRVGST